MDILKHYGTPRHSGRYPWGSGENPYQSDMSFLGYTDALRKEGFSEKEIANHVNLSIAELRAKRSIARDEKRNADILTATKLKDKGYSNVAIGKKMGINESSVRALLNPVLKERANITNATVNMLKENIKNKKYIDIGVGVENHIGISRTRLKTAVSKLKEEGYTVHYIKVTQLGTGKHTTVMVLAGPDVPYREVYQNRDKIGLVNDYTEDKGRSYLGLEPVRNINSNRIHVRYKEDGGADKDGVIEIRRGVDDLSLDKAKYAQVRIAVDDTHYLKGMAVYSDNMPPGVDIIFNTNKSNTGNKLDAMKDMKDDVDNPFGSTIRQKHYFDKDGVKHVSALNIVNDEGDWAKWSKNLSSQMLSKQAPALAKRQLELTYDIKKEEFSEIIGLTNPAIKKRLLNAFADDCDASAGELKASALPRTANHVILPFPDMKENEIYAPNYRDGERVALIRHPHGGIFEIPQLTVNNKNPQAKSIIKNAKDAVGIHPKVAERLSGADFDGDTVLVIPNTKGFIKSSSPLQGLINFDPREAYPKYEGMPRMTPTIKAFQMGSVSNLITDMTIKGANQDEIAKAVRHSMVVIDAENHHLNYEQSYINNGIAGLKKKYQGRATAGASTIISRASSQARPLHRVELTPDPITGERRYRYTGETTITKTGKVVPRTVRSTKMFETPDAFTLSSGTPIESIYASHANKLKALANESRRISLNLKSTPYSPSAKKAYAVEVNSLNSKLNIAKMNKPMERKAQLLANKVVSMKRQANPGMDADDIKKIRGQALTEARVRIGAKKQEIAITSREWEAIQAGAISTNKLNQILSNTNLDDVKKYATPRTSTSLTPAKISKVKSMLSSGYTQSEIADALGVSTSTISEIAK